MQCLIFHQAMHIALEAGSSLDFCPLVFRPLLFHISLTPYGVILLLSFDTQSTIELALTLPWATIVR